jgi:CHASE3 domain sensor protein
MRTFSKSAISLGYILIVVSLAMDIVVAVRSFHVTFETRREIERSEEVRWRIEQTVSLLKDAETGQRGFLLTGNEEYLTPYWRAVPLIDESLDKLEALMPVRPGEHQHTRIVELRRAAKDKMDELKLTVSLRREKGPESALEVVRTGRGKQAMASVRRIADEMQRDETLLQNSASRRQFVAQVWLILAACVAVVLFMLPLSPLRSSSTTTTP